MEKKTEKLATLIPDITVLDLTIPRNRSQFLLETIYWKHPLRDSQFYFRPRSP